MAKDPLELDGQNVRAELLAWVRRYVGLSFEGDQLTVYHERVGDFCRRRGLREDTLLGQLRTGERQVSLAFAEALSTNYTYFFREPEAFETLRELLDSPSTPSQLRIWSAATSSGDESYSLAITALEALGARARNVRILGTDISERQLTCAEAAEYATTALGRTSPARLARFFEPCGEERYRVRPEVRALCTFRRLNLVRRPWPFSQRFHVIFLRNVLYYFDPPTRTALLDACFEVAEPGALLVLSTTEPVDGVLARWRRVRGAVFVRGAS